MKKLTILTTVILAANLLFAQGYHIDTSFYSEALQENKMVDIYFPPGYDENPDMHYSVIYYLHGWFGSQNSMNEMIGIMESLINNGTIEPVIMVGADNSPDPFDGSMYMNSIIWGNYEDYMINDLISWVESSFRAYPSRDHRALLGISMGGYGTFRYGILHKDKFRVLAAAASQVLNLTEAVLDSTRLHVLQQNQPGPPFFYDYYNSGSVSTTQFMFLVFGAFAPNLNTPQTYINPPIVEFPLDENGDYIDTIVMKAKNNSIDHLIHQLYPEDSVGIFFGCGSGDASIYPCHIAFMDSLEMLGLPYEFYDHTGGHIMPAGFKERGLIFMDSLLSPPGTLPISCLPEGITFTTQEEIDNFQINHPNCDEIEGNVTIWGEDITNLNGLIVLTSIGGDMEIIANSALTTLTGLEELTTIEGDMSINYSFALTNLTGLQGLTYIGGDLYLNENYSLTSLAGLEGLTTIGGNMDIYRSVLTSLTGLEGLTSIGGNLFIYENYSLTSLTGLEGVNSIEGGLYLASTNFLTDLSGLEGLTSISGNLEIGGNNALTSFTGLEGLESIGGSLSIGWSDYYSIYGNPSLTSITGLNNLTSIGGNLNISFNDDLTSLYGLDSINAGSINSIFIDYNASLSTCHVTSICEYLVSPNGTIEIHNNAPGCNSPTEVLNICIQDVEKEETLNGPDFNIYPSPVNDFATLQFNLDQQCNGLIEIFNATGVRIQSRQLKIDQAGQQHFVLDFTGLPAGMYLCKVQIGNRVVAKKIIKQ
jgi:S-formylglutathione hydrolase FrmB